MLHVHINCKTIPYLRNMEISSYNYNCCGRKRRIFEVDIWLTYNSATAGLVRALERSCVLCLSQRVLENPSAFRLL